MKNHVKVKIDGILNNSLFKITMIVLCCLILSTSIIRTDNFINCMFNGLVIFAFWYYFEIGGLVGFTIICISFYLIIWGILNTFRIKELFYMLLNLI